MLQAFDILMDESVPTPVPSTPARLADKNSSQQRHRDTGDARGPFELGSCPNQLRPPLLLSPAPAYRNTKPAASVANRSFGPSSRLTVAGPSSHRLERSSGERSEILVSRTFVVCSSARPAGPVPPPSAPDHLLSTGEMTPMGWKSNLQRSTFNRDPAVTTNNLAIEWTGSNVGARHI